MKIIKTIHEMQWVAEQSRLARKRIGFVPTMGFLHEGHLSLLDLSRQNSDLTVTSIFVNPTQFAPNEDFDAYPRDFVQDETLAKERGCDILFYPNEHEIYSDPYRTYVSVKQITELMCGASRPVYFRGVTTIVAKLFNIVKPHFAVFGQKDAQQCFVIKQMVRDLNFDIEIIIGPIIREEDGLAMSSRNIYLSVSERKDALILNQFLNRARELIESGERGAVMIKSTLEKMIESVSSAKIDYIEIVETTQLKPVAILQGEILIAIAVWIGKTRLIDNLMITL